MKQQACHAARGFGILQAMVIVGIVATAMIVMILLMASTKARDARNTWVDQEAKELALLHDALMRYREDTSDTLVATWGSAGHADTPSVLTLTTTGSPPYVPQNFAKRMNVLGNSPWLQRYVPTGALLAVSAGEKRPVWVVAETGPANEARLTRVGTASGDMPEQLKRQIVEVASTRYGVPAAFVAAGSTDATGLAGAWSKDLAADLHGTFPVTDYPRAVVLVGYPDLEGEVVEDPGSGWEHVVLVYGRETGGMDAECPYGTSVIVAFPSCGRSTMDAFGSDIGTVTFGTATTTRQQGTIWDGLIPASCTNPDACGHREKAVMITETYNQILLNGALVGGERSWCYYSSDAKQGYREPGTPPLYSGPYYVHGTSCHAHNNGAGTAPHDAPIGCNLGGGYARHYLHYDNPHDHTSPSRPVIHKFCGVPTTN